MSLNMLIELPGGFDYTGAQFDGWARAAGFARTEVVHLAGPTERGHRLQGLPAPTEQEHVMTSIRCNTEHFQPAWLSRTRCADGGSARSSGHPGPPDAASARRRRRRPAVIRARSAEVRSVRR